MPWQSVVLTRDTEYRAEGATVIHNLSELESVELIDREIMVIGGAQISVHLLPMMQKLCVSEIAGQYAADLARENGHTALADYLETLP